MTEDEIRKHIEDVMEQAKLVASKNCQQQWNELKRIMAETGTTRFPKELEENIESVFKYAYIVGIATGMEETIIRYNTGSEPNLQSQA